MTKITPELITFSKTILSIHRDKIEKWAKDDTEIGNACKKIIEAGKN